MRRKVFEIVTKIINDWDPERLLVDGVPEDEYYPEIHKIVEAIDKCENINAFAEEIQSIFEYYFASEYKYEYCYGVAKSILKELDIFGK